MNLERDRFLTEAMGRCWHEYDRDKPMMTYSLIGYVCTKCGNFILGNNDFTDTEDFQQIWAWASMQDDLRRVVAVYPEDLTSPSGDPRLRNRFAEDISEALRARGV